MKTAYQTYSCGQALLPGITRGHFIFRARSLVKIVLGAIYRPPAKTVRHCLCKPREGGPLPARGRNYSQASGATEQRLGFSGHIHKAGCVAMAGRVGARGLHTVYAHPRGKSIHKTARRSDARTAGAQGQRQRPVATAQI